MPPQLKKYFSRRIKIINQALKRVLPAVHAKPSIIHKAMRYSVFAGGKRLRPILVMAGAEVCGGNSRNVVPAACALELIHTYSLIHDDLPAMDNDDLRRGRPTNHKVFGEDIAILAGDALLTCAFGLLALNSQNKSISKLAGLKSMEDLCWGAGTLGMIGGQVADIQSDGGRWKKKSNISPFSSPEKLLQFIHLNKTAALIRTSLIIGARLGGGTAGQIKALDQYGKCIGLAFQITDDILDRIGDKKKLGKKGSDSANQKLTYPALFGIEQSQKMAKLWVKRAHGALKKIGSRAVHLHQLADYILTRDH